MLKKNVSVKRNNKISENWANQTANFVQLLFVNYPCTSYLKNPVKL